MLDKANSIQEQLINLRRDFHMHPELGFQETCTSAKVAETMEKLGYRVKSNVARTGVVAELGNGKPVVAIRADMDALPLQEDNQVTYASQNPGKMHACGHDCHTAMVLGVATLLAEEKFPGTVRFLFQPSEEVGDEKGVCGAPRMIEEGVMNEVDFIIATHVDPTAPVGKIRIKSGPVAAGVDSWFAEIIGKGGHGAYPHGAIDPFYIAAHVIFALNAMISRRFDTFDAAVVSIGSINGGFTENVIPERIKITGTLRYTEKRVREEIHTEIKRAFDIARSLGGDYELKIETGVPPMINSPKATDLIISVATDLLGEGSVISGKDQMASEDFGCFLEYAQGAMFALGTGNDKLKCQVHSPIFDIDESCLPVGTAILTETATRFLRHGFDAQNRSNE
jgi:amidohydrolase